MLLNGGNGLDLKQFQSKAYFFLVVKVDCASLNHFPPSVIFLFGCKSLDQKRFHSNVNMLSVVRDMY